MRPRSNSDPSEQKPKAPLAPTLTSAKNPLRAEITNWAKKSSSGYVGLSNQGATCYLNSLLQCLYMTPEFRHSLFKWKYKPPPNTEFKYDFYNENDQDNNNENDIDGIYDAPPEHSIPYQLQCLFARLHKSYRGACSTKPLTKSFHWDDGQAFQQHDVQELLRVLFDAVSRALSRVGTGDLLNDLCKGVLFDYLDCQACHNDRTREDMFLDLSLTIDGLGSLEDAIKKFITPEIMCLGNQVNCYSCNKKQDFKKGLKFKKLPSLLIIQLKRFMFNWEINRRIKLGHKVTFPKEFDMSVYMDQEIIKNNIKNVNDLKYTLYGVIIQSGGALGGHYYAYIRSYDDNKWYCFNDSSVRELDEKTNEFENAFGGEKVRGTGYVLLYRQTNLKLPNDYGYFSSYLTRMIQKEDEEIKIQWEKWQKEMRTISINVSYPNVKQNNNNNNKNDIKYNKNGTEITIKIDVEEYTFELLLKYIGNIFNINENQIPLQNTRLRKYYPQYDFIAQGYDDKNIQNKKVEIAKWSKRGTNLRLETKDNIDVEWIYFNPSSILISVFVVTNDNTHALVNRGFVQSATFKQQDLPPGNICSVVVDSAAPLSKIKPIIYNKLCEKDIVPNEWLIECENDLNKFDSQELNLIKFDYNRIRLFSEDNKSLNDYNIKLGTMVYIEIRAKQSIIKMNHENNKENELKIDEEIPKLNASYQRSKLAVLYEEQRLKISVQYNDPLPAKQNIDRIEEILMTPKMLGEKRLNVENVFKKRLEFNHAVRMSKECSLKQLKMQIAHKLSLDMNTFRLRKSSNQPELRDMKQTLNAAGIQDGGLVYVEYGVPTGPKETCITFALYDVNKYLTDPHKKKRTLAPKLFEHPFKKDIKVSDLKKEIVNVINKNFPLYRNKYNFIQAIKILKEEEKEQNEKEIQQLKDATEISKNEQSIKPFVNQSEKKISENPNSNDNKLVVAESKTETQSATEIEANDDTNKVETNPKRKNIFGIEYVRLRKQRGAKVMEMLLDDRKLSQQIMGKKDSINLVIEKIQIPEKFTKNHLCFWLQKYRCDAGKSWNGKIFRKKEFVIDKHSKISDLKKLIATLLKKSDKKYNELSDDEIMKNISIAKGFSTSPMRLNNINRIQWVHRVALQQIGVDPDVYFYKLKNNTNTTSKSKTTDNTTGTVDSKINAKIDNTTVKSENDSSSKDIKSENKTIEQIETENKITGNNVDKKDTESEDEMKVNDSIRSYNGKMYKPEELLTVMQNALASENDAIIGRPPFHLRNGDLIVWTDVSWRPNPNQIKEKKKLDEEERKKKGNLKKNPNFKKGSTLLTKFRKEPEQLKIRTYEEWQQDEKKKQEEEEKKKLEKEKEQKENPDKVKENNDKNTSKNDSNVTTNEHLFNAMVAEDVTDIENPKPIVHRGSY